MFLIVNAHPPSAQGAYDFPIEFDMAMNNHLSRLSDTTCKQTPENNSIQPPFDTLKQA
jgi:hypothetical protein